MFNDDPYKLQRVKPQQGAVGGAPVAPVASRTPQPIGGAQQTLAQTPSIAAGLTRPGIQSTVSAFQSPLAQQPASMTHAPRPGVNYSPPALARDGMVRKPDGYVSALDPSNKSMLTATAPMPSGARRTAGRPDLKQTAGATLAATPVGAPQSTVIGFTGDGLSGKANAAAPGQVALSEMRSPIQQGFTQINSGFYRTPTGATLAGQAPTSGAAVGGRPLPGAPLVGADGSVQYDQAWADKNKPLLADYAQKNTMPFGVPAPGVAASMVTAGVTPQFGGLQRAPRGFTAEDRARQVEAMTDRGNAYRAGEAADYARTRGRMAIASGDLQRAEAVGKQAIVESGLQVAPPTASSQAMATTQLAGQKQAVDQGNAAAKLAMEQQSAALQDEQMQLVNQGMERAQAQAQQEQGLMDQFLNGTPEQQATAGKKLAVLRNTKPGEFTKIKVPVPTGIGPQGEQMYGDGEIVVNEQGQIVFDPRNRAQKPLPPGYTPELIIAEAKRSLGTKSRDAIIAELAQYGLTLPGE